MISPQRHRKSSSQLSTLWIGLLCSILGHGALVWRLSAVEQRGDETAAAAQPIPIQILDLTSDSAASAVETPAVETPAVAEPTTAPPSITPPAAPDRDPSPSMMPPVETSGGDQSMIAPAEPLPDRPSESPVIPRAEPEPPAPPEPPEPSAPELPQLPTISEDAVIPLEPPPPLDQTQSPDRALLESGPPDESLPSPQRSPTIPSTVTLSDQPIAATYRVTLATAPGDQSDASDRLAQPPSPLTTERTFDADPQATACLPNPESARRLGDTVAIQAQVDIEGNVTPLALVTSPIEDSADVLTAPIDGGHPYDQLAICLLRDWAFQPALTADGAPVPSENLIVLVQIVSLP